MNEEGRTVVATAGTMLDLLASTVHESEGTEIPLWKFVAGAFCAWISLILIGCIWIKHRNVSVISRIFWSLVVLIPALGWMLYLGLFRPPSRTGYETPDSVDSGGYTGD